MALESAGFKISLGVPTLPTPVPAIRVQCLQHKVLFHSRDCLEYLYLITFNICSFPWLLDVFAENMRYGKVCAVFLYRGQQSSAAVLGSRSLDSSHMLGSLARKPEEILKIQIKSVFNISLEGR